MSTRVNQLIERGLRLPGVRGWRERRFERAFAAGWYSGVCRGVYASFEAASAAAPRTLPLGYDHPDAGQLYHERMDRVYPGDYPMMLWLQKAFAAGARTVFDLGGHVGISYYAYQEYLEYPADVRWSVLDTPAVAATGRQLAASRDVRRALTFAQHDADANNADVLFTAGCLQYLETSLAERIAALPERPPIVLMNLVPMHEKHDFWTVQSIDRAFCAYHVQSAPAFFAEMTALGYVLRDRWENAEKRCIVQFQPEYSVHGYVGAAFELAGGRLSLSADERRG
jgi:putative methyltransferase (TIGR04325 family)